MSIWHLMIVPVVATLAMLWLFRRKFVWWEYLSLFGVAFIMILISKALITSSMTSDTEYWSEPASKVVYDGEWDEWIEDRCSYDCFCETDDEGYEHCQTCWEDCSYRDYHGASYRLISESGKSYSISKEEYDRIVDKWGGHKLVGYHNGYRKLKDNGIYEAKWPEGKTNLIECVVTSHTYENKVQNTNVVKTFEKVTEDDVNKYGLYDYPEIYGNYKQKHILTPTGAADKNSVQKMDVLNASLGPEKQLKSFILIFKNKPKEAGIMQESYWKGGNKNEFVLTIGLDKEGKVEWVHPFTWSESEVMTTKIRDYVIRQSTLDLPKTIDYMHKELQSNFDRKEFSTFDYLKIEPSKRSIMITLFILLLITTAMVIVFYKNAHELPEDHIPWWVKIFSKNNFYD